MNKIANTSNRKHFIYGPFSYEFIEQGKDSLGNSRGIMLTVDKRENPSHHGWKLVKREVLCDWEEAKKLYPHFIF